MKQYEYLTEGIRGAVEATLNQRGLEGWELVQVVQRGATAVLYLKREKPLIETFRKAVEQPSEATTWPTPPKSRGGRPKGSKNKVKP